MITKYELQYNELILLRPIDDVIVKSKHTQIRLKKCGGAILKA